MTEESRDNRRAILLIRKWLADDSGYDERVWPRVKSLLEETGGVTMTEEQRRWPRVHFTCLPSAESLLTDRVQATLVRLFPIMERVIHLERVPVQKLELFGFRDPEEGSQELVVSLSVNLPEPEALLLWDKLGHAIKGMMEYLPSYMVNILYDRISIEVLGSVGGTMTEDPQRRKRRRTQRRRARARRRR